VTEALKLHRAYGVDATAMLLQRRGWDIHDAL